MRIIDFPELCPKCDGALVLSGEYVGVVHGFVTAEPATQRWGSCAECQLHVNATWSEKTSEQARNVKTGRFGTSMLVTSKREPHAAVLDSAVWICTKHVAFDTAYLRHHHLRFPAHNKASRRSTTSVTCGRGSVT